MNRKRILAVLLVLLFVALTACGQSTPQNPAATEKPASDETTSTPKPTAVPEAESPVPSEPSNTPEPGEPDETAATLVVYFSATGNTKQLAEYAADILNADLYEIVPQDPYTDEDLAYYTGGRADQEQNDPSARPAISGSVKDMSQYDTVLIGYRIWHGQAPKIIYSIPNTGRFCIPTKEPSMHPRLSTICCRCTALRVPCPVPARRQITQRWKPSTVGSRRSCSWIYT